MHVTSKDGTSIGFTKTGSGPAVVIVNGALGYREFHGDRPLAEQLSKDFTVYIYDRRGRGETSDTQPYAVDREIEDIEALIDDAGGSAYLYGVSSGAALALSAAAKLGPGKVPKLALYEPPYGSDSDKEKQDFAEQKKQLNHIIKTGQPGDAAAFFISGFGMPPEEIEKMKHTPEWPPMQKVDHTLAYDYAVMGDGTAPRETAKSVAMPALLLNGENGLPFVIEPLDALQQIMPHAERKTLPGQEHEPSADALTPVLLEFFRPNN